MTPFLRRVQTALGQATERLAADLARPGVAGPAAAPPAAPPDWDQFEWAMAQAAAVLHGVTPLLHTRSYWQGPEAWQQFVAAQHEHTVLRHRRIARLLSDIDAGARAAGIAVVALKGAALHGLGLYAPGQRPMSDIDLLVQERDCQPTLRVLESLGYAETSRTWKHRVLKPRVPEPASRAAVFGENERAPIKIELHERIAERLPLAEQDITACVFPGQPSPGLNAYPSKVTLLMHLLLHAAGNIVTRNLRLIQLHDIALLARELSERDWALLGAYRDSGRALWWALPPLELVRRYYGGIPASLLAELAASCPRLLRHIARRQLLSEVSYASVANEAFPGLAWPASIAEWLSCIRVRLWPGKEQRGVLETVNAEPWAASTDWYRMSRSQRMLRWMLWSQPARPATMYIVDAALAASGP